MKMRALLLSAPFMINAGVTYAADPLATTVITCDKGYKFDARSSNCVKPSKATPTGSDKPERPAKPTGPEVNPPEPEINPEEPGVDPGGNQGGSGGNAGGAGDGGSGGDN